MKNTVIVRGSSLGKLLIHCTLLGMAIAAMPSHSAEALPTQVLDRVFAFGQNNVIDMATGNAIRPPDFTDLGITGEGFITCAMTAVNGLYCLDGPVLRNWPNPNGSETIPPVLDCSDAALGLDRKSICTGMTVDDTGTIWLAGKRHNAHSLIKVVPKATAGCPSSAWATLAGGKLCSLEIYAGRPVLVDITPVDGDTAARFPLHAGVLGLESRKDAVFYPDPRVGEPVVLVPGAAWGLKGKDQVQEVTLLQVPRGTVVDNYVLATASNGIVYAKNLATSDPPRAVFNIPANRGSVAQCNYEAQQHGIRASTTADMVFVSDRNFCTVLALEPVLTGTTLTGLAVITSLSTAITSTTPNVFYAPLGIAVAPGISIMLSDCKVSCAIVNSASGASAAKLQSVQLVNDANSGATVFQVKGIPDCRYKGEAEFPDSLKSLCDVANIVAYPDANGYPTFDLASSSCGASCPPAALWLNTTPLMPSQVINAFKASGITGGVLQPLLISPPYRAQKRNKYVFEALFVLTNPLIRYINVFNSEFDIPGLEGSLASLGCEANPARLIDWDVVTTVSEFYVGYGGKYVDMLTNSGCGSTKGSDVRMSLLSYDLEPTPHTWGPLFGGNGTPVLTTNNDAVFARLVQRLYGELSYAQQNLACAPVDSASTPLLPGECSTLASIWANGKQKLDKCIAASFQPKQSSGNENCQSFLSQLANYQAQIPAARPGTDIANRIGELKARIITLLHVYYTRFVPSVPASGFCRETTGCASTW